MLIVAERDANTRWSTVALALIALAGLALRMRPLLGAGGPLGVASDYDDGVYFSASALFLRGVLPYRDFVFVHPPGLLYFLGLTSWLHDPAAGFAAARILMTLVGAANIVLVGVIVRRSAGPVAALVAAMLYATYPELVSVERSAYLEPVLNLFCLTSAWLWLRDEVSQRRAALAGFAAGAACAVKLLGGIWVVAAALAWPRGRFLRTVPLFVLMGCVAGLLFLGPLAFPALPQFIQQTLTFQVSRPADGTTAAIERIPLMAGGTHVVVTILAAVGLFAFVFDLLRGRGVRDQRFFVAATLLTVVAFLASSSYWSQYNAYLAASECLLAGLGVAAIVRDRRTAVQLAALLIVFAFNLPAIRASLASSRTHSTDLLDVRRSLASIAPDARVFAFDPSWTLAAGRLPLHGDGAPVIVDSYGAMLVASVLHGRAPDTAAAFRTAPPNTDLRARLSRSDVAVVGWRGNWQMNDADRRWLAVRFLPTPSQGDAPSLWRRVSRPILSLATAEDRVEFVDGWYAEEGMAPASWRWMSSRSVTSLPAAHGRMRLLLSFYVAPEVNQPTITIALDRHLLGRTRVTGREAVLEYEVVGGDRPHELVIATDRTFVPSAKGSDDKRELGLSLTRLVWLPL